MKLFLVKREVRAKTIKEAMKARGIIYEISETKDEPEDEKKAPGFKPK